MAGFFHTTEHWAASAAPADAAVAFSELPRGRSPVISDTFTINFVLEGVETYHFDGRVSRVEAGRFLLVEPGSAGHATLEGSGLTRGLSLYLPASLQAGVDDPSLIRQFQFSAGNSRLGRLLLGASRRLAAGARPNPAACARLIAAAANEFDRLRLDLNAELLRLDARKPATRQDLLRRAHRARDYLLSHPHRSVPLAELARVAGLSQFHLARTFAAIFGIPPMRFHMAARLRAADRALQAEQLSVEGAAARFGFADRSSFARAFRRMRGHYPGRATRIAHGRSEAEADPDEPLMA